MTEEEINQLRQRVFDLQDLMIAHSKLFRDAMEKATTQARRADAYREAAVSLFKRTALITLADLDAEAEFLLKEHDRPPNPE